MGVVTRFATMFSIVLVAALASSMAGDRLAASVAAPSQPGETQASVDDLTLAELARFASGRLAPETLTVGALEAMDQAVQRSPVDDIDPVVFAAMRRYAVGPEAERISEVPPRAFYLTVYQTRRAQERRFGLTPGQAQPQSFVTVCKPADDVEMVCTSRFFAEEPEGSSDVTADDEGTTCSDSKKCQKKIDKACDGNVQHLNAEGPTTSQCYCSGWNSDGDCFGSVSCC